MDIKNFKEKVGSITEWLSKEYRTLRTGNASISVLDNINVDNYGSKTPLKNIASVSIENKQSILISPWDKTLIPNIENAITNCDLGISAISADTTVRVVFPALTSEVREMVIKQAKKKLEESKISLRNERDKIINELQAKEKNKEISKDEKFNIKKDVEDVVKDIQSKLQNTYDIKEKELSQ